MLKPNIPVEVYFVLVSFMHGIQLTAPTGAHSKVKMITSLLFSANSCAFLNNCLALLTNW